MTKVLQISPVLHLIVIIDPADGGFISELKDRVSTVIGHSHRCTGSEAGNSACNPTEHQC